MLEWNVYIGNFNSRKIEAWNVFKHVSFVNDFGKFAKKLERNKELTDEQKKKQFSEQLCRELSYYYWSKCEWEIVLDHWPHRSDSEHVKIDVYDQIRLNWERFVDYTWENRRQLWTKKRQ